MELWKQAYRAQFGSDADEDTSENADEIEAWRASWQGGFDAGEEWALALVGSPEAGLPGEEDEGA